MILLAIPGQTEPWHHGVALQSDLSLSSSSQNGEPWQRGGPYLLSDEATEVSNDGPRVPHLRLQWTSQKGPQRLRLHLGVLPASKESVGLVEAEFRQKWKIDGRQRLQLRAGLLIPPISVEHRTKLWGNEHGIRPSVLNTWVGEEVRPLAVELRWFRKLKEQHRFDATFAIQGFNDTSGIILSWRGWAMHTHLTQTSDRLTFQKVPGILAPAGGRGRTIVEVDGRPGFYGGFGVGKRGRWHLSLFHSDAMADSSQLNDLREYAWDTRFTNLGLKMRPHPRVDLRLQGMAVKTKMGPRRQPAVLNRFDAWMIECHNPWPHHLTSSVGYQRFRVEDLDDVADRNASRGEAFNFSLSRPLGRHELLAEWVQLRHFRRGNGPPHQNVEKQNLFQIRFRFTIESGVPLP